MLTDKERAERAARKGASKWRYLDSAELDDMRAILRQQVRARTEFIKAERLRITTDPVPARATTSEAEARWRAHDDAVGARYKYLGAISRITTILRDRWYE